MAASGHLLILLVPVLSLCGTTEYYVRPTEPTNTSCPAQPCLTLSQYTSDSDHYFKSNTVLNFLPGTHHIDRPVTIGNVHNVSLESLSDEYPHLVAQFSCETEVHGCVHPREVCCAALWLHDMYNVTVKGISITVQTPNMSGVVARNVSGISIQLNTTCSLTEISLNKNIADNKTLNICFGIAILIATSVRVHSSSAKNCSYGFLFVDINNTYVTKATAMYNEWSGIIFDGTTDTHVYNTIAAYNSRDGMYSSNMKHVYIANMTATHNGWNGMKVLNSSNTRISNMTTTRNGGNGVDLSNMNNTCIFNMVTTDNRDGVHLSNMNNTHITNTTAAYNSLDGMSLSTMNDTVITNTATTYNDYGMYLSNMNNTHITNTTTTHNDYNGVELFTMSSTRITNMMAKQNGWDGMYLSNMNNTYITEITTTHNGKNTYPSAGVCCGQVVIVSSMYTLIYHTSFTDIYAPSASSTADPTSLPAVIALYESTLHVSGCDFTGNNISAVRAHASNITVSGNLTFSDNRAFAGTAFVLTSGSVLTSAENSHTYFLNNRATNTGGVFYISTNNKYFVMYHDSDFPRSSEYFSSSTCFLNTEGGRFQTRFTFVNNSAGKGGDILYGGQVAYGLDGEWNCLDSFKNVSNVSQHGLSLISSDPSRVCLCDGRGQPDCLIMVDPTPRTVYPGQTINISAVVVGQDFGTVSGSAYAQFLHRESLPHLHSGQEVQGVTQHNCSYLYYTIFSQSELSEAVLVLTAHDSYVTEYGNKGHHLLNMWMDYYRTYAFGPLVYSNNPVYVNISLLHCPPGFMLTTHSPFRCDCNSLLEAIHGIQCHIQEQAIGRSGLQWVGMMQNDNGTNGTVAASEYCPMDYCKREDSNVTLSDPDSQCNYNHSGTLCGGCQPGLSLALGSVQCLQCSNKYLALLILFTLAGPVLVFSIKLLDLTISQGTLNGLIFYANVIKANEYIFLPQGQTYPLTVFIAWLNLDLGVETCFFQGLTVYSKTWLQFVFPFYIWSITGLIIILARNSVRVAKVMGNNSVPVLATLLLLSYAKLLRTIITALSYTMVYTSHGVKAAWTADGNVDYLGPQHAPLFTTAVVVLLFLWLPYTLLLFLGQWLHMCNSSLIAHMLIKIKPFLDAHYGPLKSKHRYWFGILLLVRVAILLISALVPANRSSIVVLCISVSAVLLTHFGHLVYCNLAIAMFDVTFFMNLALLTGAYSFTTTVGGDLAVSAYTSIGIAFVQFVGLVIFKVFSILKQSKKVMGCFCKGHSLEDDWELYEQAALQREMESDTEEQDSEGSGSIESLPTY